MVYTNYLWWWLGDGLLCLYPQICMDHIWLQVNKRTQKLNKHGSETKEKILAKFQKQTSTRTSPKGDHDNILNPWWICGETTQKNSKDLTKGISHWRYLEIISPWFSRIGVFSQVGSAGSLIFAEALRYLETKNPLRNQRKMRNLTVSGWCNLFQLGLLVTVGFITRVMSL